MIWRALSFDLKHKGELMHKFRKGILIGGLTGLILNALGSKADEAYKQYQENNLFTQKAIAAYRQNFLDARAVNKS